MFDIPRWMEMWIVIGLAVMVVLFLMGMMARLYRKAGRTRHSSCTDFAARAL